MDEIKFEYMYSNGKDFLKKSFTLNEISNGDCYDFISDMPMYKDYKIIKYRQYTGIKDKNGKEIYEGDIIKKDGKNWKLYRDEYGMYKLEGRDNGGERDDWDDNPFLKFSEAVGNIYENPELLNNN